MRRRHLLDLLPQPLIRVLLPALVVGLCLGWASVAGAATKTAGPKVVRVVDGDTVQVRIAKRVRTLNLAGLNAPELGRKAVKARKGRRAQKAIKAQCGSLQARAALKRLLVDRRGRGRQVKVQTLDSRRGLSLVKLGNRDAGQEQLKAGWARTVRVKTKRFKLRSRYGRELAAAQRRKRGIFGRTCVKPPQGGTLGTGAASVPAASGFSEDVTGCNVLRNPIDPRQQTALPYGRRSNWLQPWRAYLDTRPASALNNGTGIIFDAGLEETDSAARLLAASGFRRARYIIDWASVRRRADGTLTFTDEDRVRRVIEAFRKYQLRPMILLAAEPRRSGVPQEARLTLSAPAAAGGRSLALAPDSVGAVAPGRTGIASHWLQPGTFITSVAADGTATLSRPLDRDLAAGALDAITLDYAPFERPNAGGGANPAFQRTLDGWLEYARFVTQRTRDVYGSSSFDVEVWNELSFNSEFLDANLYAEPDRDIGTGDTNRAILEATARHLKDPANGVSGVRVGDGFASMDPIPSGATAPPGVDAVNKHPYAPLWDVYPGVDDRFPTSALGAPAVDARGVPDDQNTFAPSYRAHFPEHYLTGLQTDHLIRDLSPITTEINGVPHGRFTRSDPNGPYPRIWVSEHTLVPVVSSQEANQYVQGKIILRSVISYVGAGAEMVALYSAADKEFGIIPDSFLAKARNNYPGDDAGGRTLTAMQRLAQTMEYDGGSPANADPLELRAIGDCNNNRIFRGDGAPGRPSLFHRNVLAAFPFQTGAKRYVVPYYVMTRDTAKVYRPELPEGDMRRYDFPPERFTLELGGLSADTARVMVVDPLDNSRPAASVIERKGDQITVDVEATDSPRLLVIEE